MTRKILVTITADTRHLRRALIRAQLCVTRSRWRRLKLHVALLRLSVRERA